MKYFKVNRRAFTRLRQADLAVFARMVVNNTFEDAAYTDVKDQVDELKTKTEAYESALQLAGNGGKELVHNKNLARKEVLLALTQLSHALDLYTKDNSAYIVQAGFDIKQPPQAYTGILLPPEILQARSNGMPGQLEVSCKIPQRTLALMTAVEWSTDNKTWHNGTYSSASRFELKDLPSRTEISIRLCALGSAKRKSTWTDPVTTFVM